MEMLQTVQVAPEQWGLAKMHSIYEEGTAEASALDLEEQTYQVVADSVAEVAGMVAETVYSASRTRTFTAQAVVE
jgi:hypothetical protein